MIEEKTMTSTQKAIQRGRTLGAYGYPTPNLIALKDTALEVTRRVARQYGEPHWSEKDPLSMLVIIVLSQRTRDRQTSVGYAGLKARFATWEEMRDAPVEDVQAAIAGVNWPELKAPRLQAIMRQITAERGALSLDFLCDLPLEESVTWLHRLHGVGPKTVACTLLFSCQKPVLPVDTHVRRVSMRLGLIGSKVTPEAAHSLLQALLPDDARTIYNYHNGLLEHGQQVCVSGRPRCERCVLTDLCAYYNATKPPTESSIM